MNDLSLRNIIVSLVVVSNVLTASSQDFTLTPLPTQRLLPTASIHTLFQDSEGYLWYATESGLCRDNGYQIDVFRPSQTKRRREACRVNCIAETAGGDLLFGTDDGLFCVRKCDYTVQRVELDSTRAHVEALYTDGGGRTWVGTKGHIFALDAEGGVQVSYPSRLSGKAASVASFYEDRRGTLFVLQWGGGVLARSRNSKVLRPLAWPLTDTPVQMLEDRAAPTTDVKSRPSYWVLTSGAGVQHMEVDGERCLLTPQTATLGNGQRERGLSMLADSLNGLLWVTTLDDLYAYRIGPDRQLTPFTLDASLPVGRKILDQLLQSRDGDIYVSGYTPHTFILSGVQRDIERLPVDAIRRETGFPVLADRAVWDGDRYVWIWQGRQGLMLYDRAADRVEVLPRKFDRTLVRSSQGGVWVSDGSQVLRLWQEDGAVCEAPVVTTPGGVPVRCLFEQEGQALFVATADSLYRLTLAGRQLLPVAALAGKAADMAAGRSGGIYVAAGSGGLLHVTPQGDVQRISTTDEDFLSVCAAADGIVWASTFEGNVYHYTTADGLLAREPRLCRADSSAVKCIRTDGLGHVWALADQQVCEFAPQSRAFRVFGGDDVGIDVSYFYTLELIDPLHVGIDGAGALVSVQSSAELSQQTVAQVVPRLASVYVHGKGVTRLFGRGEMRLSLSADEEDVTLHLTTLDHLHAADISFAYQLEGVNRDWVYLPQGVNAITLSNLSKGCRRLRVMATDRYGCWSQPTTVVTLCRAAHWYDTWRACLLLVLVLALVGYNVWRLERRIHLLHRLIRRKSEVRLNEIEMKREDIDALKRDDEVLRNAINKIEEHLSDTGFNVGALAAEMCMSRITLYRRLQELTGQSPTGLIRDIRLKQAARLLTQSPDATVADVARKVGFATPKYFSRCFKEKFGMLPKDYGTPQTTS